MSVLAVATRSLISGLEKLFHQMPEPRFVEEEGQALRGGRISQQLAKGREVAAEAAEVRSRQVDSRVVALAGSERVAVTRKEDRAGPDLQAQTLRRH